MSPAETSFYTAGGTLPRDSPSYVERQADRDLFDGLSRGEFCYVLTSRQMGKSSLMVRTAVRLRQEGAAVVLLDLTAVGRNLSPEQWYGGLLGSLGQHLELEEELDDFWEAHLRLGPLQRWMAALRDVVLARRPGRIVIFIDEIDVVRGLPFATDEFFAAIRECYNRRTEDPEFGRLAFCLLGVASPSDLIRDTRLTPFNVGRRIELTDFTEAEAAPLAAGFLTSPPTPLRHGEGSEAEPPQLSTPTHSGSPLRVGEGLGVRLTRTEEEGTPSETVLLQRILYWTGGHPYLTQRLCRAIVEASATDSQSVDDLCQKLFLSKGAQEKDDNLLFVRERLLRSEADLAGLLDLYRRVRAGKRIEADDAGPLVDVLRLSGAVRAVEGRLRVRNRIYERVFDPEWVTTHMPDAELRRQKVAYRRGLLRATTVSLAVLALVSGLAVTAVNQAGRANRVSGLEKEQRRLAEAQREEVRRSLYAAHMNLAQQSWETGDLGTTWVRLDACRPEMGEVDLRGFEWRYLWHLCRNRLGAPSGGRKPPVHAVAFSPDGRLLAAGTGNGVALLEARTGRELAFLTGGGGEVLDLAFSADGTTIASVGDDHLVRLWNPVARRQVATLSGHAGLIHAVAVSPDGRLLASGDEKGTVKLWDLATRRAIATLPGYAAEWHTLAFSPNGRMLAIPTREEVIHLWEITGRRRTAPIQASVAGSTLMRAADWIRWIYSLTFSPDGRTLATGTVDGSVKLWNVATRRAVATLWGHGGTVRAVVFSPDGTMLASGSEDRTLKLWDLRARREVTSLCGHRGTVGSVAFSPDGKTLVSGSDDGTVKQWDVVTHREIVSREASSPDPRRRSPGRVGPPDERRETTAGLLLTKQKTAVATLAFSPDGHTLALGGGDAVVALWDVRSRKEMARLQGRQGSIRRVLFSPDGTVLAAGCGKQAVILWDLASRRLAAPASRLPAPGSARGTPYPIVATLPGYAPWDRPGASTLAFSPDSRLLAMGGIDRTVQLWDLDSRRKPGARLRVTLDGLPQGASGVAFSPDGRTLAAGSDWAPVRFWNVASRREAGALKSIEECAPLLFSPDGKTLLTGHVGGFVKLSDVATRRTVAILPTPTRPTDDFALSPDGTTLAVKSADTIRLWNLAVRREAAMLKGHTGPVAALAFSPDGSLLASAGSDGEVRLWRAARFQETDPLEIVRTGAGDRRVMLEWRPLSWVLGYNVYRGPAKATPQQLVKLNPRPVTGSSYTDLGPGLVNGRAQTYAVATVFRGTERDRAVGRRLIEGPRVQVEAIPGPAPPGFTGYSIDERPDHGSVSFDAATGVITVRGSGGWIYGDADQFYFVSRRVTGDFRMTIRALTLPRRGSEYGRAGLMVRETLAPGARNAYLFASMGLGLVYQWRPAPSGPTDSLAVIQNPEPRTTRLRMPMLLRLTRRGNHILPEYSQDDGRSFRPADEPLQLQPPLPETVHVGLAVSATLAVGRVAQHGTVTEAEFSDLKIETP